MIFAAEKDLVFSKYWCFRELVRIYSSTFLIMLSPTMNTDVLKFLGLVGFWDVGGSLSLSLYEDRLSLFITWLILFIFENVTSVLVKCVVSSRCARMTLSICISFTLLFCFSNFVNWRWFSEWMAFEAVHIQVSWRSSFFSEMLSSFGLSNFLHSQELRLSSVIMIIFSFSPSLKKSLWFLSEEIWLCRLQRSSSKCLFSFVWLGSCCLTSHRMACFSFILAASS